MRVLAITALAACLLFVNDCGSIRTAGGPSQRTGTSEATRHTTAWPPVILWAWERPEDLSFINPRRVGVSYLVKTIRVEGNMITVLPNLNGLRVPAGTWIMACAHIEGGRNSPPNASTKEVNELVSLLASLAKFPNAKAVQVDFDATVSQRGFYRKVLEQLRRRLPRSMPLSMTALASWCEEDDWISKLPVTEAVPMLFQMGPGGPSILMRFQAMGDFDEPLCRKSVGISTDEFVPSLPADRRLYIFDPKGWTKAAFESTMARVKE